LREGGARLPTTIGQTIGIVGGLVIGEAAVSAGIVSPVMVIVVALNEIASFAVPTYSVAITFRIIMFSFMLAAAVFGLFGSILAHVMLKILIVKLMSIGVLYSPPFAPTFLSDWNDLMLRAPIPLMTRRPKAMQTNDKVSADRKEKWL